MTFNLSVLLMSLLLHLLRSGCCCEVALNWLLRRLLWLMRLQLRRLSE